MDIRRSKLLKVPRKLAKLVLSFLYHVVVRLWKMPVVKSVDETLDQIIKTGCSVTRLGDGEISIIVDKASYPFQEYDSVLAARMSEILKSEDESILVCLPIGFQTLVNLTPEIRRSWQAHIAMVYPRMVKLVSLEKVYYNASITRPYISFNDKSFAAKHFEKIKRIWHGRDVLLIEGEKSRLGVSNDLFSDAVSVKRLLAPMHNAFRKYSLIFNEALRYDKNHLVLIALGPTATVLAYDLAKEGYQAIDIGNIDIEYEWFRQQAKEKVKISGKYTSEAKGGTIVADVFDEKYDQEIVKKIV